MKNKKINTVIFFFIIFCLFTLAYYQVKQENKKNSINDFLNEKGISLQGVDSFVIDSSVERSSFGNAETVILRDGSSVVKIKTVDGINKEMAIEYVENQKKNFNGLYEVVLSPYPEAIEDSLGCDDIYKPVLKNNKIGDYYLTYASDTFSYGVCSDEMISYKAILGYFYCEENKIFVKSEIFTPKENDIKAIEEIAKSFSCIKK